MAAFECKTTLRRKHIGEFIEHSKKIEKLAINENGTPRKDLQSKIYYGLLAHSHEWKKENSNPKENIEKAIWEYDEKCVTHPREIPDIICVADLGVWKSQKMIVPNYDNGKGLKGNYVMSGYIASDLSLIHILARSFHFSWVAFSLSISSCLLSSSSIANISAFSFS